MWSNSACLAAFKRIFTPSIFYTQSCIIRSKISCRSFMSASIILPCFWSCYFLFLQSGAFLPAMSLFKVSFLLLADPLTSLALLVTSVCPIFVTSSYASNCPVAGLVLNFGSLQSLPLSTSWEWMTVVYLVTPPVTEAWHKMSGK